MKKLPNKYEVEKEIKLNRNHSWIREIYARHKHELDRVIINYLGNCITYKEFFDESQKFAKALKANGVKKGDEFVVCLDRTPEVVYLIGAASLIGAKIKLISDKFVPEFIKQNINQADSSLFFVQDIKLDKMKEILKDLPNTKVIPISYKRSLNEKFHYLDIMNLYYNLDDSKYENALEELPNIYSLEQFLRDGAKYEGVVEEESTLDDVFTITYSSGTTKKGLPKGIVHTNRHYILMGRYHDVEVSGIPSMTNLSTYSNIPVYSNSYISSSLSDNLIQGGTVILDPVDDPRYFKIGMQIHESNMNIATTSTWLLNALDYYACGEKYKLEGALFNFAAGEQLSPGEEKFLNKFLHDVKAGVAITHTPMSVSKMSTAGSDCEHGSLFIRIFRAYFNKSPYRFNRTEPIGMYTYDFVDVKVLREDGTYALPYEYGRLVCNSGCTMKEYDRNPEATTKFFIKDAYGKVWGDMNVYGYLDEKGNITMKGRVPQHKTVIPEFLIADEIAKDTKNIMSCEVVSTEVDGDIVYVAHIMPQLNTKPNNTSVLNGIMSRCINKFGEGIRDKIYIRFRNIYDYYPLTSSEKRDAKSLQQEGISKAEHLDSMLEHQKKKTSYVRMRTRN